MIEIHGTEFERITAGELIRYLNRFPEDADLGFLIANPKGRKLHKVLNFFVVTDCEYPVFCMEVSDAIEMDAEIIQICEEEEEAQENGQP